MLYYHYWYFLDKDMLMMSINLNEIAILSINIKEYYKDKKYKELLSCIKWVKKL